MTYAVDEIARDIALRRWALPECLHVPIAAVSEEEIQTYIGDIVQVLAGRVRGRAFLVRVPDPPPVDRSLPIWDLPGSEIFHRSLQVWVDISYTRYRAAYRRAYPEEDISSRIISHAMNRRTAALKGYRFVRVTSASRASNSSSAFTENWAVDFHGRARDPEKARGGASIQYADLCDLMLMLDLRLGGGVMELVNQGQELVRPRS
ncbi:hypothetical protein [Thalassobaculum sp.]|uniref:hypothetical protein n=1 Tax=Thalassobaculum sp. TaxID=2022740 RepID=UPI0032F02B3B